MLFRSGQIRFMDDKITIEKVQGQDIQKLVVPIGTTIGQILGENKPSAVGVFGKLRSLDYTVQAGDRVEIYQQLHMDPKEARRVRAKEFKK